MNLLNRLLPARATQRITFGFMVALVLIAVGFVLSFYSYSRHNRASGQIEHTYQVMGALTNILSLLKDAETGVRGYVIAGDSLFLEPYTAARQQLPRRMQELTRLTSDNAAQVQMTDTLAKLVAAKLSISEQQLHRGRGDQRSSQSYLLAGKVRMDRLRQCVAYMVRSEQALMRERNRQAAESFRHTLMVIFSLSVLTFLTLIVSYNLLDSELARRQENEDKLRTYENELKEYIRQLEVSNEELERFAFVASHDLQEPLRKIQSFGALLTQRYTAVFDEEGTMFLARVMQSAERMSGLIKDLLNFSRISTQESKFKTIRTDQIVQRVLDKHDLRIRALGAQVEVDPLPVIQAVPGQMDQLFANLIANALKFTRPDTPPFVRIRAEAIDGSSLPELTPGRTYYRFLITDNGIGFDEKYLDHIFKVFQRLHGKNSYEGTGIGLAICKKIVTYHKGYITANSRPGEGATFVVIVPEKQTNDFHDRSISDKAYSYTAG